MDRHVKILGILNMVYGGAGAVVAIAILIQFGGFQGIYAAFNEDIIGLIAMILVATQLVIAIPCIVAGYHVRHLHDWARVMLIMLSALNVLNFPFGTVIGPYGLWVLMTPETDPLFQNAAVDAQRKLLKAREARKARAADKADKITKEEKRREPKLPWSLPRSNRPRLRLFHARIAALLSAPVCLLAQQTPAPKTEVIVVTGSYDPIPLEDADRAVRSINIREMELISNTFADFLRLDSSLDLRQRAPGGLQSDLSIRGGSFGQTLILLNGLRLNDVQSGHHNLDVPVPLESVEKVEILKGSGSTMYGSDAVGGVVNFITRTPEATELRLRAAVGNFGVNQERGVLTFAGKSLTQQFSFSRDFSSGFRPDRDYRNLSLSSTTHYLTALGATDITLANNDKPFGADQFYGPYNSWERTRTWFTAIRQSFGEKTEASFAYRRHSDLFVLYRDRPEVSTNRHAVEGIQAAVRRRDVLGQNVSVHYGLEGYRDAIDSNNLGHHDRARGAGYVSLDVRALKRFSFSAGVREELYGRAQSQLSPSVSGGYWLSPSIKLRAGVSRAFRLPSYTDLYYHDPANIGSPNLRPEKAWTYEGGLDWTIRPKLKAEVTVFRRNETDDIDFVRYSLTDIWRATNFQHLNFTGVEASLKRELRPGSLVELQYTGLRGAQDVLAGAFSKYTFNYPIHSGVAGWQGFLPGRIIARARVGVVERYARDPYGLVEFYAASTRGRVHPFVQLTNVTDTAYQEIFGVAMPGRAVVGGVEFTVFTSRK